MPDRAAVTPRRPPRSAGEWGYGLLFTTLLLAIFLAVAWSEAGHAARGERVLSNLDSAIQEVRVSGKAVIGWLWSHPTLLGWGVTGLAAALAVAGLVTGRLRAFPLPVLFGGITLATWGQLLLEAGKTRVGWWLYGGGVLCSAVVGAWCPIDRLRGFPRLPLPDRETVSDVEDKIERGGLPSREFSRPATRWEYLGLLVLVLLGLFARAYALNELPSVFDDETISIMTSSYTLVGIGHYVSTELLGTGNGVFHVLTNFLLYTLLGASIYTVRLTALFWGVAAIPLFYWLVRRLAGIGPAILSTLLFVAAPEQLFWSRSENSFFSPVAVLALITAHVVLGMVTRFSPVAVLAAALWMPFCRYFYTPCFVMFMLPLLMFGHSLVFVRGTIRRARYVAPILLAGLLLWVFSLSFVTYSLQKEQGWTFVHPGKVRGVEAWKQGMEPGAGLPEIVRVQARRISKNLSEIAAGMADNARYQSHWYARFYISSEHRTMINSGLAVLSALGMGYLLGQFRERRAALLLLWVAVGLLPACMSDEPEARRLSLIFPALTIIGGLFIAVSIRILRERAGVLVARGAAAALGLVALIIAFTSLASHLLLPAAPLPRDAEIRLTKPLFERSDTVFHSLVYRFGEAITFGNLDLVMDRDSPRCLQYLQKKDWLSSGVLSARCDFSDSVFQRLLTTQQIEARRKAHHQRRVGYLIEVNSRNRPQIELLRGVFPSARARELTVAGTDDRLFTLDVDKSEIEALRSPELEIDPAEDTGLEKRLLSGVSLLRKTVVSSSVRPEIVVRGGIGLQADGWYRFRLDPPCVSAKLSVGQMSQPSDQERVFLAGVHPFEIRLPTARACRIPFRLVIAETTDEGQASRPADLLLTPRVVGLPEVRPPRVVSAPGYGEIEEVVRLTESTADLGRDGQGNLYFLVWKDDAWKIRKLGPDGREKAVFLTALPGDPSAAMSVDRDGNCVVMCQRAVEVFDHTGNRIHSWELPSGRPPADVAWTGEGRILISRPDQASVELYSAEGDLEGFLREFGGGRRFSTPAGLAVSSAGDLVVVEESGQAMIFRMAGNRWPPPFLGAFPVDYPDVPLWPDLVHCAFDSPDRIVFPHRALRVPLLYNLRGERVLAASRPWDLSAKPFTLAQQFAFTPEFLFVLDVAKGVVYRVRRQ